MISAMLRIACACLALGLPRAACLANTAYMHPEAIFEGDIAELVIEYDSKIPSLYALDTAPLETDFEILESRSRVIRLDDSNAELHRMQWRLQLLPRKSGNLTVPALDFGNQSSPPLKLEVKPVPDSIQASQAIFVELKAEPDAPYVGQQTRVILRLFHNTPIRIDGLAEPDIAGTTRYSGREESIYFVNRNGSEFRVLERHLDIFPQAAGQLELPPVVFRGELREPADVESNLPGRKISRSSDSLTLKVREPPPEYAGRFWLPAREVLISQRLEAHDSRLEVGDSVDWILTLVARGLTAESLPRDLLEFESDNYTVYADQVRHSNRFEGRDLVGRLEQRFAVIVTGPGPVDLPAITLRWWDLSADRERQARLEASRIGIAQPVADNKGGNIVERPIEMFFSSADGGFRWARMATLSVLLGLVLVSAGPLRRAFDRRLEPLLRRRRIHLLLKQACLDNHAARARALAIEWGRACLPGESVDGLFAIGDRTDNEELAGELAGLDAALFAPRPNDWRGKRLWKLIASENRRIRRAARTPPNRPPGLYPGWASESSSFDQPSAGLNRSP